MLNRWVIGVIASFAIGSVSACQLNVLVQAMEEIDEVVSISDSTTASSETDFTSDASGYACVQSLQGNTLVHQRFIELIKLGDYDAVKQFLDGMSEEFDINYQDAQGKTALMYATERWGKDDVMLRDQILHLLMQRGAAVSPADKSGLTVHHYIASNRAITENKRIQQEVREAIERIIRKSNRTPSPMTLLQRQMFHRVKKNTDTLKNKNIQSFKIKKEKKKKSKKEAIV